MNLVIRRARLVTPCPTRDRGALMGHLEVIPVARVVVRAGVIVEVGPDETGVPQADEIDADGRVLMPAFVDCHTHACWAGSRIDEWEQRLRGATYQQIMASGGGILSTVRAVRAASEEELAAGLRTRLNEFLRLGTTTVEIKSGYGLSTLDELKMLRAIRRASKDWAGTVVPTALLGHAIDPDVPNFVERTLKESLPAVHREFPDVPVDVFVENGAWSVEDAGRLLEAARCLGHPVRLHTDQFSSMGGIDLGLRLAARSVDHLEAGTPGDLERLGASQTTGVGLPVCGLHLDGRYANLRKAVDAGGRVAIATNYNPGSAPSMSMPLAIALAVRFCGLTPGEAIAAATLGGAHVLGFTDRGFIAPGARADLILLRHRNEAELAWELGGNPVEVVVCNGRVVHAR
jgi:imidazolonepropionase